MQFLANILSNNRLALCTLRESWIRPTWLGNPESDHVSDWVVEYDMVGWMDVVCGWMRVVCHSVLIMSGTFTVLVDKNGVAEGQFTSMVIEQMSEEETSQVRKGVIQELHIVTFKRSLLARYSVASSGFCALQRYVPDVNP